MGEPREALGPALPLPGGVLEVLDCKKKMHSYMLSWVPRLLPSS